MKTLVENALRRAAEGARISAQDFSGVFGNEDLREQVLQHFRAFVFGKIESNHRIDRAAGTVREKAEAVMRAVDLSDRKAADPARQELVEAIDDLERAVLRFGVANASAGALGVAVAGQRIADD